MFPNNKTCRQYFLFFFLHDTVETGILDNFLSNLDLPTIIFHSYLNKRKSDIEQIYELRLQ